MKKLLLSSVGLMAFSIAAMGQAADTPFQVSFVSELDRGEAYVTISNDGASSTVAFPTQNGNVCANIYVFSPTGTLLSCCSCNVPPNNLVSAAVKESLLSVAPNRPLLTAPSLVVKLLATTGAGGCGLGGPSETTAGTGANVLVTGMVAWNTSLSVAATSTPTYAPTRIAFTPSTLSAAELTRITTTCAFTQASPAGICKGCQVGGH